MSSMQVESTANSGGAGNALETSIPKLEASNAMRSSLESLQDALRCSLCNGIYCEPMTLSCAHSFCRECIDAHACHSWDCPYPKCGRSYSIQTSGSFRKVNPTLQSLVTSLHVILDTLQRAPPHWWREGGDDAADIVNIHTDTVNPEENEENDDESVDLQNARVQAQEKEVEDESFASADNEE